MVNSSIHTFPFVLNFLEHWTMNVFIVAAQNIYHFSRHIQIHKFLVWHFSLFVFIMFIEVIKITTTFILLVNKKVGQMLKIHTVFFSFFFFINLANQRTLRQFSLAFAENFSVQLGRKLGRTFF